MTLVHATCVVMDGAGVLLRGPPGSGKSDLALRLIDGGAALVADDQVSLTPEDGRLIARPPDTIAGRMEVRGVGIETVAAVERATVALVIDLVPPDQVDRLPAPACCRLLGVSLPRFALAPFEASAPAKVRVAVRAATRDGNVSK
jgi:serine kinase of HPr protein (carbohydrate metabolism regulator)